MTATERVQEKNPVIQALRTEAKRNPAFRDVCLMFSQRQRTRGRLTVTRMKQAMEEQGFMDYSRNDYANILMFLSKLGIGDLKRSKRGKVQALENVSVKLNSIGAAAIDGLQSLEDRIEQKQYADVSTLDPSNVKDLPRRTTRPRPAAPAPKSRSVAAPMFLTMIVAGQEVKIPVQDSSPEAVANLVSAVGQLNRKDASL